MTNSFPLLTIPWHIQDEVFKYMNPISRISMRHCSKRMRQKMKEVEPSYKSIEMYLSEGGVEMKLVSASDERTVVNYRREAEENVENCVPGEDYIQRCTIDFCGIVANPRVTVDFWSVKNTFRAQPYKDLYRDMQVLVGCIVEQMNVLGEQMKVKSWCNGIITHQDEMMSLLSVMKPGILEKMELWLTREENLDRVTTTEHWKRARQMILAKSMEGRRPAPMIDDPHEVPIEKLLHIPNATVWCRWVTIQDVVKIIRAAILQGEQFISYWFEACLSPQVSISLFLILLINQHHLNGLLEFQFTPMGFIVRRKQPMEQVENRELP